MSTLTIDRPMDRGATLEAASLEEALRAVEPGVMLLPRWLLRGVIVADRGMSGWLVAVPHRKSHLITRGRLMELAAEADLALPPPQGLPAAELLVLLPRPSERMAERPAGEVLRHYWRLLFHARIDAQMRRKLAPEACTAAEVQRRIQRIGRSAFNEARVVLARERFVGPEHDDRSAYGEWVAVYLELRHFRPDLLPAYFPALAQRGADAEALAREVDGEALLRQTRPAGADDPHVLGTWRHGHGGAEELERAGAGTTGNARAAPRLIARAARAAAVGNTVRAAILRARAAQAGAAGNRAGMAAAPAGAAAGDDELDALTNRLRAVLEFKESVAAEWRAALEALLSRAVHGWWTRERRLLYDLQKCCVAHEREIYSVGVVEWLLDFGRRPLRRPQPNQRRVLVIKALRSALRRLGRTRLDGHQRTSLGHLLHDALHHAEARLRHDARPAVAEALIVGAARPRNAVERVAEHKLVEELLDGLASRGFLTLGNVRDAMSRNQLKLDDIAGFSAFIAGDPLLQIDRRLANSLDGVYHRGEWYLRFFQRASSVLFATRWGRAVTRTVLLPIGGAFVILEALDHTLILLLRKLSGWEWLRLSRLEEFRHEAPGRAVLGNVPFILVSVMLLGILNWPAFREGCVRMARGIGRALREIFVEAPKWMASLPWVQAVWRSRAARLVLRYAVKPAVLAAVAWLLLKPWVGSPRARWITAGCAFAAGNVLFNSRAGRAVEQAVFQWVRVLGARLTTDILANALRGIARFFRTLLEQFERTLYAVDESLRFRAGQGRGALVAKATLGVAWFYVAYVARFAVNLLVEPQINPIKHFPVVTVSHKIVLPTVGVFSSALERIGISTMRARTLATGIVFTIPGIFGFLAWELRANWMLYRANRPRGLKPVHVGGHGETVVGLLRPGFHSGTVPKIFARLRRAGRRMEARVGRAGARAEASAHKQREAAEHVREAVANFVRRDFVTLLHQHAAWREAPVTLGRVEIAVTRVSVELLCPAVGARPAWLHFEQRAGWILASVDDPGGWMGGGGGGGATGERGRLLSAALLGLYKMAGVDLVAEQIEAAFEPEAAAVAFELSRHTLTIWPSGDFDLTPLELPLTRETSVPSARIGRAPLFLRHLPIEWETWVGVWEPRKPGTGAAASAATALPAVSVLPALAEAEHELPASW